MRAAAPDQHDSSDFAGIDIAALRDRQAALCRRGKLHWVHWAIMVFSIAITLFAWYTSKSLVDERVRQAFQREADRVVDLMAERMKQYEDALLAGVAAMQSHEADMTQRQWHRYAKFLSLEERYPGVNGIGVIHFVKGGALDDFVARVRREHIGFEVYPDHPFDFHLPITHIEPEDENAAALGLDVAFESNRRAAALRARRLGTRQISGPIVLVQDVGRTPGFLFYAPFYEEADEPARGEETPPPTESFRGFVYAPLVVRKLVAGVLGRENRQVSFAIRDGDEVLYDEHRDERYRAHDSDSGGALYRSTVEMDFYGRTWTFDIQGNAGLYASSGGNEPLVVLIGGLMIDAMLVALFVMMVHSNRQTLALAEEMTDDLGQQAIALGETNQALESFAYVVSHDLKTPIRSMESLTVFLEDDLENYLASPAANPDVRTSLDEMHRQVIKSNTLISGILDYSRVGAEDEERTLVDSGAIVAEIARSLSLREGQLRTVGEFPVFRAQAVRFSQVLENLIGNAFKYNDDPDNASATVTVERRGEFYRFSVADNGPGIEPRFHGRVFEAFRTLQTKPDIHSSGIGLSIVKKSVETLGGCVGIESGPGRGATFHFTWPAGDDEPDAPLAEAA